MERGRSPSQLVTRRHVTGTADCGLPAAAEKPEYQDSWVYDRAVGLPRSSAYVPGHMIVRIHIDINICLAQWQRWRRAACAWGFSRSREAQKQATPIEAAGMRMSLIGPAHEQRGGCPNSSEHLPPADGDEAEQEQHQQAAHEGVSGIHQPLQARRKHWGWFLSWAGEADRPTGQCATRVRRNLVPLCG